MADGCGKLLVGTVGIFVLLGGYLFFTDVLGFSHTALKALVMLLVGGAIAVGTYLNKKFDARSGATLFVRDKEGRFYRINLEDKEKSASGVRSGLSVVLIFGIGIALIFISVWFFEDSLGPLADSLSKILFYLIVGGLIAAGVIKNQQQ